ncbi:ALK tyrosine kinase receptor [Varanus komodoensis]|nr:ALK tyrosine kinase receptor [Varanus komodoensis]
MALQGSFSCWNGTTIKLGQVCDFARDCADGEDEGQLCKKLPPGFYCSFEDGECGWTQSSLTPQEVHLWHIGNPQYNHLCALKECALLLNTSESSIAETVVVTSAVFPAPMKNSPCEASTSEQLYAGRLDKHFGKLRMSWLLHGILLGDVSLVLVENKTGKEQSRKLWHFDNRKGLGVWQKMVRPLRDVADRFWLQIIASWKAGSEALIAFDNVSLSLDCYLTINEEKTSRDSSPDAGNLFTERGRWEETFAEMPTQDAAPVSLGDAECTQNSTDTEATRQFSESPPVKAQTLKELMAEDTSDLLPIMSKPAIVRLHAMSSSKIDISYLEKCINTMMNAVNIDITALGANFIS